jgi:hypothetical protein
MNLWIFLSMLVCSRKIRKLVINSEGTAIGRNSFRLFTYLRSPIEWCTNEQNRSGAPGNVPSLASFDQKNDGSYFHLGIIFYGCLFVFGFNAVHIWFVTYEFYY